MSGPGRLITTFAVTLVCAAVACALPPDFGLEPLPTVDTTALSVLTPHTTQIAGSAPPVTSRPAASSTHIPLGPTPTPVPTRTPLAPWTHTPRPVPAVSTPAAPTTQPAPAVPGAPPPVTTPPVNRYNDVSGPVDVTGTVYGLALVASGIPYPVALADPRDGSGRLFIAGQEGRIYVYQNGAVLPEPFMDIDALVIERKEEQGFLGLAFHPNYARNGFFYVHYISPDLFNIVERYTVSRANPNKADASTGVLMLRVQALDGKHNGGQLAFGPFDGDLYVGLGDGGGANDPNGWAQNLSVLRGKILRLEVDAGLPYAIPLENPFDGAGSAAPEVWAYGFRNPWRFSFDRARGDLWIAEVGQENTEEINFQEVFTGAGLNYGWALMEGLSCHLGFACEGRADLVTPLQYYFHEQGRCAIIGGFVSRGPSLPGLTGAYLYGDYCSGEVWAMRFNAAGDGFFEVRLLDTDLAISSFGEDAAGEIYVLSLTGEVYRIVKV